jgi:hypothetical protein
MLIIKADINKLIEMIDGYCRDTKNAVLPSPRNGLERYYRPIYGKLLEIHTDYARMFTDLSEMTEHIDSSETDDEVARTLKNLKEHFAEQRNDPDWSRQQFRSKARGVMSVTKRADARIFLASVLMYFVETYAPVHNPRKELARFADAVEKYGEKEPYAPDLVIDSPSFRLKNSLQEAESISELHKASVAAWENIGSRVALVVQMYHEMEANILKSSKPDFNGKHEV